MIVAISWCTKKSLKYTLDESFYWNFEIKKISNDYLEWINNGNYILYISTNFCLFSTPFEEVLINALTWYIMNN